MSIEKATKNKLFAMFAVFITAVVLSTIVAISNNSN